MRVLIYTSIAIPVLAAALFAGQPTPVSVSPASQTFNTSTTTNYTFVASDPDGAGDLLGIDALFGSNYQCWLFYNYQSNQISVFNNNGANSGVWTTETAGQAGATLQGNACSIDPSTVSASASGNNLSVSAQIALGGSSATYYIYLSASNVAGTGSPYVQLGSYTITGSSQEFFSLAVSPNQGFIPAGGTTTGTVTITDQPGFNGTVNLSLGPFPTGSGLSGSFNPASITGNGTSTLTITSSAESPTSADPVTVNAATPDASITHSVNFVTFIDRTPPTLSMTLPSPNTGTSGIFNPRSTDGASRTAIQGIDVLINSTLNGENACWMWYDATTNYLWLASDDESSWNGVLLDGPVTVSNSQCTVASDGSSREYAGSSDNTLSIGIAIEFAPGFAGTKNVYADTANRAGFDTGYQLEGTYTVQ